MLIQCVPSIILKLFCISRIKDKFQGIRHHQLVQDIEVGTAPISALTKGSPPHIHWTIEAQNSIEKFLHSPNSISSRLYTTFYCLVGCFSVEMGWRSVSFSEVYCFILEASFIKNFNLLNSH